MHNQRVAAPRASAEALCEDAHRAYRSGVNWDDLRYFLELARTGKLTAAARRLSVEHTTVSRRVQACEASAGAPLFTRSASGYALTEAGRKLLPRAEAMEQAFAGIERSLAGESREPSGLVRIGCSEAYGTTILPRHLVDLASTYPNLSVDLLALPRVIQLPRNEADIVITIDRPERGPYVSVKLADYVLRLYASKSYLANTASITTKEHLKGHRFISYVEDFTIAKDLPAAQPLLAPDYVPLKSTSILAQRTAAIAGAGIAILPTYLITRDMGLEVILDGEVRFERTYWMAMPLELKGYRRIRLVWEFLRKAALRERPQMIA